MNSSVGLDFSARSQQLPIMFSKSKHVLDIRKTYLGGMPDFFDIFCVPPSLERELRKERTTVLHSRNFIANFRSILKL